MKTVKDMSYSFHHVKDRMIERFNLDLQYDEFLILSKSIETGSNNFKLIKIEKQSNGNQSLYLTVFKGKKMYLVYNTRLKYITTVLKPKKG